MKKKLLFFLIVCCIIFYACNNYNAAPEKANTICKNWQLISVQNVKDTIQINTSSYHLKLNVDSSFNFTIEDNQLTGKYATMHENLLQLKDVIKTDVCCNTNLGKQLETIFSAQQLHYALLNDTTLLLNAKNENTALIFNAVK